MRSLTQMKQQEFQNDDFKKRVNHGGEPSIGKRKSVRPFTPETPLHIVLKSKRARGQWSLLHRKNRSKVISAVYHYAKVFKVHVYRASNNGNELQLLVKASEKKQLQDYLRVLAGRIACFVTGAKKYVKALTPHPDQKNKRKFWDYLCWSRLVSWGKDFYNTSRYALATELEEFPKTLEKALSTVTSTLETATGPPKLKV